MTTTHPRLRKLDPSSTASANRAQGVPKKAGELRPAAERVKDEVASIKEWRAKMGGDWIVPWPTINPNKILEEAECSLMAAAFACQQACYLLGRGHHQRVREYLVIAYEIAQKFRGNDEQIERLSRHIVDGRAKIGVNIEQVKPLLLHYFFIFAFFQSGMTTRDTARQYAEALQPFFDSGITASEVAALLQKYGQSRLRQAASKRLKLIKGAQEWAEKRNDPGAVTIYDVLSEMDAEDTAKKVDAEDKRTDYGPRELPPDYEHPDGDDEEIEMIADCETAIQTITQEIADRTSQSRPPHEPIAALPTSAEDIENEPSIEGIVLTDMLEKTTIDMLELISALMQQLLTQQPKKELLVKAFSVCNDLVAVQKMIRGR